MQRTVRVYPRMDGAAGGHCGLADGGGCGRHDCAGHHGEVAARFQASLDRFRETYADRARVEVADYASELDIEVAVRDLNAALARHGADLCVSRETLPTMLAAAAPVVLIDGAIAFLRGIPPAEMLADALDRPIG